MESLKKLQVWKDKDCRRLFGTIPVISVSFGSCKGNHFEQTMRGVTLGLYNMYVQHEYLRESSRLKLDDDMLNIPLFMADQTDRLIGITLNHIYEQEN